MAAKTNKAEKRGSFGKKRTGVAKNMNTPKGKKISKYRGQGR